MWVKENDRSYKKLLPALDTFPNDTIVTADDDVLYPRWWLEELLAAHAKSPSMILGHRAVRIQMTSSGLTPYVKWPRADRSTPASEVFLTGVGGILYPPHSLPAQTHDLHLIRSLCPGNDDIWFRAMSLLQGTHVGVITNEVRDFPSTLRRTASLGLASSNVFQGENDRQLKAVFDHFDLWGRLYDGSGS